MPDIMLAVAAILVVVSAIQGLARRLLVSDAVLLALVGIAIGTAAAYLLSQGPAGDFYQVAVIFAHFPVHAQLFLLGFLPALVFQGALSIDVRRLTRDMAPVLLLAIVAVVATTAAVGFALQPIGGQPLMVCLLLGAIISTTDSSAVISIFRGIGADGRLTRLVEGESLLNDATAIALFTVLLAETTHQAGSDIATICMTLAKLFLGGIASGHILARLALAAMPYISGSRMAEVTLTLALPYVSYIVCEQFLGFSGVVAAASAGLTFSAIGPSVLRPRSWSYLLDVWAQTAFLATSLVFVLASMLVPRLLLGMRPHDLTLIAAALAAAMVARAAVLFLLMPVLRHTGLAQRIPLPLKLTMLWGGLRGSITLAMALAVTENREISPDVQEFIAILATGFVLFTLLVNGTTLRILVHWLKLDRLSPIDQALRHQVVALELAGVRDRVRSTAEEFGFLPEAKQRVIDLYAHRIEAEAAANTFDASLTDRDRVRLGLLTFASQERTILLEIFRERGVSYPIMEHLLRTSDAIIDATRADGRLGYLRAAKRRLRPGLGLRLAAWLHRRLRLDWPLTGLMARQFEMVLVMRLVFLAQLRFMRERMTPVLGARVTGVLGEIVERRRGLLDDAMEALGVLYPAHGEALQSKMLRQIGLRFEMETYTTLRGEALLSDELFGEIQRDVEARRDAIPRPVVLDLRTALRLRLQELAPFGPLAEAKLDRIAKRMTMRLVLPGERIRNRRRRRGGGAYLISSGEVEIEHDGTKLRLGRGALFGGDGVLGEAETRGAVTAVRFCLLLALPARQLRGLPQLAAAGTDGRGEKFPNPGAPLSPG